MTLGIIVWTGGMAFSSKRWRLAGGALYVDGVQYFPHGEIDIHTGRVWRTPTYLVIGTEFVFQGTVARDSVGLL